MKKNEVKRVSDVFGVSRDLPLSYIERESVDNKLISDLSLDKHVVIYGSSKQGKTCLRKHCLNEDEYILVQCQNSWGLDKLAESILKEAGFEVEVSTRKTTEKSHKLVATVSAKIKAMMVGELSSKIESQNGTQESQSTETRRLEIDPSDPNDLVNALTSINFDKYIVLEDFHYLPQETQQEYAFFLKTIHERSKICFIIIAVWREENRLIIFNGDLSGRVVSVDADEWKDSELQAVIELGEKLLNVVFPKEFKSEITEKSLGSVYLVQECCRRICEANDVYEARNVLFKLDMKKPLDHFIQDVVKESGPRYSSFLTSFSEGFQDTQLNMYKWLLYPVLTAKPTDLETGLGYKHIRDSLGENHPTGKSLNPGNVTQALNSVSALQSKKAIKPFVLDYDQVDRKLSVVDKGFLIWLASQDIGELTEDLGITSKQNDKYNVG